MKKIFPIILTLALFGFALNFGTSAYAQNAPGTGATNTSSASSQKSDSSISSSQSELSKNLFGLGAGKEAELKAARERLLANKSLSTAARKTELENLRKLAADKLCTTIKANFAARLEAYDTVYQAQAARYAKVISNVTDLISRLQTISIDTTALATVLENLKAYSADFTAAYNALLAKLTSSQAEACDSTQVTAYKQAVARAVELLVAWKSSHQRLNNYISHELKDAVLAAKQARDAQRATSSSSTTTN